MLFIILMELGFVMGVLFVLFAIGFVLRITIRHANANLLSLMGAEFVLWLCFTIKLLPLSLLEQQFDLFFKLNSIIPLTSIFFILMPLFMLLLMPFIFIRFGIDKAGKYLRLPIGGLCQEKKA